MDKVIHVFVRDKIATAPKEVLYVCGNSDYSILFDFDEEWLEYTYKTARFNCGPEHIDVVFSGNTCPVPKISNVTHFYVGAYAGDLRTTTPAYVSAKKSILCNSGSPKPPTPDVYAQIMEKLNSLEAGGVSPEQIAQAVAEYMKDKPTIPSAYTLPTASADTLGGVKIGDGLQMTGDVLGLKPEEYELIETIVIDEEDVISAILGEEADGTPLKLKAAWVRTTTPAANQATTGYVYFYGTEGMSNRIGGAYVSGMSNTTERTSNTIIRQMYGRWFSLTFGSVNDNGNSTQIANYAKLNGMYSVSEFSYVRYIEVRQQYAFPVGSIIEFWGVRADA